MPPDDNPYLPPEDDDPPPATPVEPGDAETERVRKEYLEQESLLRSIGGLYFLAGVLAFLAAATVFAVMYLQFAGRLPDRYNGQDASPAYMIGVAAVYIILGAPGFWIGFSLGRLRTWARIEAAIFAVFFLFGYPLALVLVLPTLFLLFSEKSIYVCTPEYRDVIQATPHIRQHIALPLKILLAMVVVMCAVAVFSTVIRTVYA